MTEGQIMKRLLLLCLCATAWLSAGGQSRDWADTQRYAAANAALAVRPKVVFMGDSITEGWYKEHPGFFDGHGFAARGISGQVTAQMLARFQSDVVALRPRAVVILAGTNDIARNNGPIADERIADNIRSMAELARAHGMRVFLCSVLPAARYGWRPEVTDAPERIERLNGAAARLCASQRLHVDRLPSGAGRCRPRARRPLHPRRRSSHSGGIRRDGGRRAAVSEALRALTGRSSSASYVRIGSVRGVSRT